MHMFSKVTAHSIKQQCWRISDNEDTLTVQVLGQCRSCNRGGTVIVEVLREWRSCNIEVQRQWTLYDN